LSVTSFPKRVDQENTNEGRKISPDHAKERISIRLQDGMGRRSLLAAALWSMCLVASCFRPESHCERSCKVNKDCPGGLVCLASYHLCAATGEQCHALDAASDPIVMSMPDAPADDRGTVDNGADGELADARDGSPDADAPSDVPEGGTGGGIGGTGGTGTGGTEGGIGVTDGGIGGTDGGDGGIGGTDGGIGGADGGTGGAGGGNCHDEIEPPTMSCWNGHCLTLTETMQIGSVLWLDPSNLGPAGSSTNTWCDQSGDYNDAFALSAGALPKVMPSGGLMLDYGVDGAGLVVPEYPTLDFGAGDFTILMVVGFNHGGIGKTFFLKQNNPPGDFPKQLVMEWLIATPPDFSFVGFVNETEFVSSKPTGAGVERVYGLRRIGDDVQLRVNGNIVNTGTLLTRGASTDSNGNIYLGSRGGLDFETVDTIRAAIMIGGSLTDQEVGALEAWLLAAFGIT